MLWVQMRKVLCRQEHSVAASPGGVHDLQPLKAGQCVQLLADPRRPLGSGGGGGGGGRCVVVIVGDEVHHLL